MVRRSVLLALAMAPLACGGRALPAGGADASAGDDGSDGLVVASCAPEGVRVCGGSCGDVSPCPGSGCTHVVDGHGNAAGLGVCWSDLSDKGSTPCALCDDGQGCVQRSPGLFVCVPLPVCGALLAMGATDVCWYGDKAPYEGSLIPTVPGCPAQKASAGIVCGGDCSPCGAFTLDRCVGRGPSHPFGICPDAPDSKRNDLANTPLCTVTGGSDAVHCAPPPLYSHPSLCAVYPYPPAEQGVATRNGFCVEDDTCKSLAASLPGGLWCFDAMGNKIAP